MSKTIEMSVVCLPDGQVEVQQYGEGEQCRQTRHPAADILAIDGPVADAARRAIASPGEVCGLQIVRPPKKYKPRKAKPPTWKNAGWKQGKGRKPVENTSNLNWQSAGWTE